MTQFALFDSPLNLALGFWQTLLSTKDHVIDATCGHGYDALKVLPMIPEGFLYGIDIQKEAIESTEKKLSPFYKNYELFHQSHAQFPKKIAKNSIKLIIYNLGYLPQSDKVVKTNSKTTLESLDASLELLSPHGVVSIMIYSGHSEGEEERNATLSWAEKLNKSDYLVTHHELINRHKAPSLCLVQKKGKGDQDVCCQ